MPQAVVEHVVAGKQATRGDSGNTIGFQILSDRAQFCTIGPEVIAYLIDDLIKCTR